MKRKLLIIGLVAIICFGLVSVVSGAGNPAPGGGDVFGIILGPFDHTQSVMDFFDDAGFEIAKHQVFSEGCLEYGFETWLTIYNSSEEAAGYSVLISGP